MRSQALKRPMSCSDLSAEGGYDGVPLLPHHRIRLAVTFQLKGVTTEASYYLGMLISCSDLSAEGGYDQSKSLGDWLCTSLAVTFQLKGVTTKLRGQTQAPCGLQ